ncbi:MAG TPA: hypothetical protein V6C65_40200 [Allocoleopsis sp.]
MVNLQIEPSQAMGRRQLEAVAVYVTAEVKQQLEEWAEDEERSVSWIVGKLINDAIAQKKQGKTNATRRTKGKDI